MRKFVDFHSVRPSIPSSSCDGKMFFCRRVYDGPDGRRSPPRLYPASGIPVRGNLGVLNALSAYHSTVTAT